MSGTELVSIVPVVVMGVIHLLFTLGLFAWARFVGRRHGTPFWRRISWLPIIALLLSVTGVIATVIALVKAFGGLESVDAADRAAMLAENISMAMNFTAIFAIPSALLYVTSFVVSVVGTVKRPRASEVTDQ